MFFSRNTRAPCPGELLPSGCLHSSEISPALDREPGLIQHVGVDHGRDDIGVSQQFLHCSDVIPCLKEVRGKGVAQSMAANLSV